MSSTSPVHVEYQFTMLEWREAHQARTYPSKSWCGMVGGFIWFGLAFTLAAVVHHSQRQEPPFTLTLIYWGLAFGVPWFFVRRQIRGVKGSRQGTVTLDVDDQAVQISVGVQSTRWRWEEFAAFFETERLLVLCLKAAKAVVPIPKRALSEAQIEQVRHLAAVLAVPRSGGIDPPVKP